LDNIYLLNKRQIVNDIKPLPKDINSQIGLVNDIRNAVAHSFFPQNRRQFKHDKKVVYKKLDLYTRDGLKQFMEDTHVVIAHLWKLAFPRDFKRIFHGDFE
jgi:hypothetical protein